ncbi:MAG: gamma carbonic anhydrase family protein [Planctomycetes bacterium]|nr:gamma carbonic anhydrase family protein [Planctomycetota bacterium]
MPLHTYRGKTPKLHPSVFVADGAQLIGDVELGEDASVWFNVVLRGDVHHIRIGARTNIQDGSIVHVRKDTWPTLLGDDVTVGHGVNLHGCRVRDRCLIGIGAILLDDAEIASDSIVAAGALVPEGFSCPPRSLVMGFPAKVKRPLTDDEVRGILQSSKNYVAYVRSYREG